MKRLVALVLVATFAISLSACGAKTETAGGSDVETTVKTDLKASYKKLKSYVESKYDLDDVQFEEDDQGKSIYGYWYTDKFAPVSFSEKFKLDGQTIVLGSDTLSDLEALGFVYESDQDTIGADEGMSITVNKDDRVFYLDLAYNDTDKPVLIAESPVTGFSGVASEFCLPYEYMSITYGSTFDDVIKSIGDPNGMIELYLIISAKRLTVLPRI